MQTMHDISPSVLRRLQYIMIPHVTLGARFQFEKPVLKRFHVSAHEPQSFRYFSQFEIGVRCRKQPFTMCRSATWGSVERLPEALR
jgi:hypothetical protein